MKHVASPFIARKISLWHRTIAAFLMPSMILNAPPVLADLQSDIEAARQDSFTAKASASVVPPQVKPNRTLPSFTPPPMTLSFSAQPSDQEIFTHSPFEEPLVPIGGKTSPEENAALGQALLSFSQRAVRDDFSALENFLIAHPQSPWRVSLLTDLGWCYRQTGWYSKAMEVWEQAWALGKTTTDPRGKAIVDRALSELIVLNARVGRIERLEPLLSEIQSREMVGSAKEKIEAAKQGYTKMVRDPQHGYRCGPQAVETLREHWGTPIPFSPLPTEEPSSVKGTSLTQIYRLAHQMSMDVIMAKRAPGSAVLVPAVVNWKVGHFAAIIGQDNGQIHLHDLTFGSDVAISQQALDAESSGYFLIKNQPLPPGWTAVSEQEGQAVWGKGPTATSDGNNNKKGPTCGCPGAGGGAVGNYGSHGMANYKMYESVNSLSIDDTPLYYQPAYGPPVEFTISYSQRELNQPSVFTYANLGPLWTWNFLSYITETNPGFAIMAYDGGGGTTPSSDYNGTTHIYATDTQKGTALAFMNSATTDPATSNIYEQDNPDGSKQIFGVANFATPRKVFLTRSVDPAGNALVYYYDSDYRLTSVKDATGLVTTLSYGSTSSSNPAYYRVTGITDPFGRTATLTYNSNGQLASSTDMAGIVSSYGYLNGTLQALVTPYGITRFDCGQDGDKRWIQIYEPQGGQQRLETWTEGNPHFGGSISTFSPGSSSFSPPSGVDDSFLEYRNAVFWDRKAMLVCGGTLDYAKAVVTHMLHETNTMMSDVVEGIQEPLESRVYYNYPGQTSGSIYLGANAFPSRIVRQLSNGHTQETDLTHNALGNTTQVEQQSNGTVRSVTNYTYSSNAIDLTQVAQVNGSASDVLVSATYNSLHEPLTVTDASGQTTTYTYNTAGQVVTVTNAKSEVTTYAYDSDGYLTSITGPVTGASVSFTYDSCKRVRTTTDRNGYVKTYDYDADDHVTQITYSDGTTENFIYTALDVTLSKDRQNRWTRYSYNALGQLLSVLDPQGRTTGYERCTCGALTGLVDGRGNRTTWAYDLESRPISKTFADGHGYTYNYDTGYTSRLLSVVDPNSQTTSYAYNDDDTPSGITYADSSVALTYDPAYARLTSATKTITATSASYATAFTYNPVSTGSAITGGGRLATETGPLGSTAAVTYSYDELGRVTGTSIADSGGANVSSVTYDTLGRIHTATNPLALFTYTYYGTSPRLETVSNNVFGLNTLYSYQTGSTQDYRLTDISNYSTGTTVLSKFDYSYTSTGTIQTEQEQTDSNTPTLWTYGYDNADQLTSAVDTNTSTSAVISQYGYGYDPAGNRTREQIGLGVNTAGYNNLNQRTSASAGGPLQFTGTLSKPSQVTVGGSAATYGNYYSTNFTGIANVTTGTNTVAVVAHDVNGNYATNNYQVVIPSGSSITPTFDYNGNCTNNGAGQAYTWDAQNELITVTYTGGATSNFTYDAFGRRLSIIEKNPSGTVTSTKQSVWVASTIVEERDASNSVAKRFYYQGEQIGGTSYFYTRDHLGSIREMVDSTGTIQARYDYDPYGRTTLVSGTNLSDFQFGGYYMHQTSGLYLTQYRAYDPNTARWLSRDPLGEGFDSTLYSYVWNDPVDDTDPWGLAGGGRGSGPPVPFTVNHSTPPGSMTFTAPNGQTFLAPPGTNFQNVYNAGKTNGMSGMGAAVGHYGTYDYQRNGGNGYCSKGNTFYPAYTNASNYAVGVYLNGAGVSPGMAHAIANTFASMFSSNAGSTAQQNMQTQGYNAAQSGNPNGTTPPTTSPTPPAPRP